MDDLEGELLKNLSDIELLKQLSERLNEDSSTKRMKTTESLAKVLEEYKLAGVFKLQNSVTDFLWKVFRSACECCLQGIGASGEKFQAAWCLVLLNLIKIQIEDEEIHENTYFIRAISILFSNRSYKVLAFLIREYQDIAISLVRGLEIVFKQDSVLTESIISMLKSLPSVEKIKNAFLIQKISSELPKKRKRIENFDPEVPSQKVLVNTESWEFQYSETVSKLWISVLARNFKDRDLKLFLKSIPNFGFDQVSEPMLFSDFFLKSYDMGGSIAVLALNGLFVLSTQYNLEPKLYYTKLYILLKQRLSQMKTMKPGFLRLVELSLSSHLLPSALVASFVKLFMHESLRGSTFQVTWNVAFALKCIKTHPTLAKMIHNDYEIDLFNYEENDPMNTHANESSLWEVLLLKKYYLKNIKDLVTEFEKPLEKIPRIAPSEIEITIPDTLPQLNPKEYEEIKI